MAHPVVERFLDLYGPFIFSVVLSEQTYLVFFSLGIKETPKRLKQLNSRNET